MSILTALGVVLVFVAGLFLGGLIGAAVVTCMVEDELEALDAENERVHDELMAEIQRKDSGEQVAINNWSESKRLLGENEAIVKWRG